MKFIIMLVYSFLNGLLCNFSHLIRNIFNSTFQQNASDTLKYDDDKLTKN